MIGLMMGVASLIIISSFSEGFSDAIRKKLSTLDGHIRITTYSSLQEKSLTKGDLQNLTGKISTIPGVKELFPYVEEKAMVRSGNYSDGVIVYGMDPETLESILGIAEMMVSGTSNISGKEIIIGSALAEKINIDIGDKLFLIDIRRFMETGEIAGGKYKVAGTFKSGFSEYDRLLVFMPVNTASLLFNKGDDVTGMMVLTDEPEHVEKVDDTIMSTLGFSPFITSTWKERHAMLFRWLNIYDIPIKIVIIFITLVAVFNITVTLNMTINEKYRDIGILQAMGYSKKHIRSIFIREGFFIGLLGAGAGVILGFIILWLQSEFRFISLSSDVYFLDYLPVNWSPANFILFPVFAILFSVLSAYIPAYRSRNIHPAEALKYE